jgi:hypothetical protein
VPASGGDVDRAFDMLLTFDLAKIEVLISKFRLGPCGGGPKRQVRLYGGFLWPYCAIEPRFVVQLPPKLEKAAIHN